MSAIYSHSDRRALFPALEFTVFDFCVADFIKHTSAHRIDSWRATIPGEFSRTPVPMIRVTTTPPEVAARADIRDIEDELDAVYRTSFWFFDRRGWRAAYRLARIIISGRRINASLMGEAGALLCGQIAAIHWAGDES